MDPETVAKKKAIRDKAVEETYDLIDRQRFGLFSQPGGLAIGDDAAYEPKTAQKDDDGHVKTELRNIQTTGGKKGNIDDVLFSHPGYTAVNDKYKDPKPLLRVPKKKDQWKEISIKPFKPAGNAEEAVVASPFEHMSDLVVKKR